MIDFRLIVFVLGLLLATVGLAMLVPALVDVWADNPDWLVFALSSGLTFFVGFTSVLATYRGRGQENLSVQQAFILTTASWIVIPLFAALPFSFSVLELSYTDAFFEAMSGLTTTGSTVITGLDSAPPGILLWRALLQWMGGIGIIVMAVAILPLLQIGGMQLFRMESSDTSEKVLPRVGQIAAAIGIIYFVLTALCTIALWSAGTTFFEASAHAMTTIATGGFSTSDLSVGYFDSVTIDAIVTVFMLLGSLPFLLYLQAVRGQPFRLWSDSQVRWFLSIVLVCIAAVVLWQTLANERALGEAVRYASFNVVSIITGTGYSTADYAAWGSFPVACFFFFMFVGGCAGSTSCGLKIFRFQVLYEATKIQMYRLLQPHGVFVPHYNGRPLPEHVIDSVFSFIFLFILIFGILTLALFSIGLDFMTALSGAATAIANVGPALGDIIGPTGTFAPLPDSAKWVLSLGMLLGRLELLTVLVLFTPQFWKG